MSRETFTNHNNQIVVLYRFSIRNQNHVEQHTSNVTFQQANTRAAQSWKAALKRAGDYANEYTSHSHWGE